MREEEKKRSSQNSSFKRFLKKRWAFPAIYIASAAIILTAVLWFQNGGENAIESDDFNYEATDVPGKGDTAIEVNRALENVKEPVKDADTVVIQTPFYDFNAKAEEQEAALVFYNNQYRPNRGIDYVTENGESFEVTAALSGTVTKVEEDTLLGNVIEVDHGDGIVTNYQSVTDIQVEVGTDVKQGDVLATAGESLINEEAGVHVHFEIRKDGKAVNPIDFYNKPLSALQEFNASEAAEGTEEESAPAEDEEGAEEDSGTETESEENGTDKESEDSNSTEEQEQTDRESANT